MMNDDNSSTSNGMSEIIGIHMDWPIDNPSNREAWDASAILSRFTLWKKNTYPLVIWHEIAYGLIWLG